MDMQYELKLGDCLEKLKDIPNCSVDSIVTDPPAGIFFMGKDWDKDKGGRDAWISWMTEVAKECFRVLKPGGHALVWAIPRTSHWTGFAWEQAGWEPRDKIYHAFGTGFPKNHDISKAIDKAAGAEREVVGTAENYGASKASDGKQAYGDYAGEWNITTPATNDAKEWQGWGTALKPAVEEWWLFRKPLSEKTIAENVLKWGTGGLNIDGCRIGTEGGTAKGNPPKNESNGIYGDGINGACEILDIGKGRWPAQLTHDGSEEIIELLSDASRFFYCTKANKRDRDEGCEGLESRKSGMSNGAQINGEGYDKGQDIGLNRVISRRNHHPTVKPTNLMVYLCKLITPPKGLILDPFMGSGSTGKAAIREGFRFIGIEQNPEYLEISRCRIENELKKGG
jgi:hypothetical protein